MKKIIALLLACMMVVGLAACESAPVETTPKATEPAATTPVATEPAVVEPEAITLTVWAPQEDQVDENSWLQVQLKAFEAAHPEYAITWNLGVCSEGDALGKGHSS